MTAIAICMPTADMMHPDTMFSVMRLDLTGCEKAIETIRGKSIDEARNMIVGRILFDPDCKRITHFLWVDDDMVFEPDAAKRLLAHDLPIVGALAYGRRAPHYAPILLHRAPHGALGYQYQHHFTRGLVKVDATGSAFILVKREVYEAIEERFTKHGEGPYSNSGEGVLGCGEDVSFCERAKACGFDTWVDTSVEAGHIGEVVVDTAFAERNRIAEFNPWHPPIEAAQLGQPLASIVIPTWNQRPEWLRAAVETALGQGCPVEVIVVDDGSDPPALSAYDADDPEVKRQWAGVSAAMDAGRLTWIREEHRGCFHALNRGIAAMRTEWFTWLSSDDLFKPVRIARQLDVLRNTGERFAFTGYDVLEGEKLTAHAVIPYQWRSPAEQRAVLSQNCMINGLTVMIARSALDEVRLPNGDYFDTGFKVSADWDLWCRLGRLAVWRCIPEILATRRVSPDMASARYERDPERAAQWKIEDDLIRRNYGLKCAACGGSL